MEIVEIEPDILNIDSFSIPEFNINESFDNDSNIQNKPTANFGGGIELLMNVKNKNDKKVSSSIDIEDITNLESELNNLASNINDADEIKEPEKTFYQDSDTKKEIKYGQSTSTKKSIFGDLFGSSKVDGENVKPVTKNVDPNDVDSINLGKSTANMNETKTWDGYGKFNNIPINLEKAQQKPQLTKEEELREKFKYMRKLDDLEKKGISLSKRYTMDSNLDEMIGEYETIVAEKEKSNAIKFQGKMMMACITGLEFLNSKFDPFDIKLDGWGEQINENIDDYDDIFAELHEKYKSKAKMSPELKLLFQLGGSAIMVHMSNTLFKSSMPGMDDIMRQNPELMKQFTQAAVNTMGQTNPGFGGFMNGLFAGNNNNNNNNNNKYKILVVSADIQNDVYHLVDPDDVSNKLIASIPDYKTSVFMNALFRNIKENRSLDALEESDDEDEFENTNIDKFVDLTKKIKMKCVFNHRFKKWTPVECVK